MTLAIFNLLASVGSYTPQPYEHARRGSIGLDKNRAKAKSKRVQRSRKHRAIRKAQRQLTGGR